MLLPASLHVTQCHMLHVSMLHVFNNAYTKIIQMPDSKIKYLSKHWLHPII